MNHKDLNNKAIKVEKAAEDFIHIIVQLKLSNWGIMIRKAHSKHSKITNRELVL